MKFKIRSGFAIAYVFALASGCSMSDIVKVDKPQLGTDIDHDYFKTGPGALALLNSSIGTLQEVISSISKNVGIFTDELADYTPSGPAPLDSRTVGNRDRGVSGIQLLGYAQLQAVRVRSGFARYFLKQLNQPRYNFAVSATYALEGYSIVILAENLCSGVPLSQTSYGGEVVYGVALSTDSLFKIAVSKFDSALAIDHDSTKFKTLARIGKGRALMALGRYSEAAEAVADVQPGDSYRLYYTQASTPTPTGPGTTSRDAFWTTTNNTANPQSNQDPYELRNFEGGSGIQWYSNPYAVDPRLPVTVNTADTIKTFPLIVRQRKYVDGNIIFKLAEWAEAKVIQAEDLLNKNDPNWIEPLNVARRTVGLPDIVSPANTNLRVDLLFRERAYWFYLNGTRLADLRRLVRNYGRETNSVFPSGSYPKSAYVFSYGDAVVFIPSASEFVDNQKYDGCLHLNP